MSTYQDSGVDSLLGDRSSKLAYDAAKRTFAGRKGLLGEPVNLEGGFTGALDFGDFYVVQNDDGIGSKVLIAEAMKKYDTLGYDLLAMVADDAVCVGAEVVSITNVIDNKKVEEKRIQAMMDGLSKACVEQKIVIAGGEIGELPDLLTGFTWNATAVGVVEKNKFITGKKIAVGDKIIGLRSRGFRSNGFSLVRFILNNIYGPDWTNKEFKPGVTWGEVTLTPSIVYHAALLSMHGRYKEPSTVDIKGLAHVTGGGIPGNLVRIFETNKLGAHLDNLPTPHEPMLHLQDIDTVKDSDAYETWNMGLGMIVVSNEVEKVLAAVGKFGITGQVVGEVVAKPGITLVSQGFFEKGRELRFE